MKGQQPDSWRVSRDSAEGNARLHREIIVTKDGVGAKPSVQPATIVQARYNGDYEGAPWVCFPVHVQRLSEPWWRDWDGDEIECQAFSGRRCDTGDS